LQNLYTIERVQEVGTRIRESVQRVIVGKSEVIDLAIVTLLCHGHILAEDVPGIGKTTMAKALAQSLGGTFRRIQFTPDLMPNDVLGVNFFNQKTGEFEFYPGPIFSQVLLADEINRATPRTQSALLEAMQERQSTIDGVTRPLPRPFLVIATQNPIEMEGTFPLPEAQLDRFMTRIKIGYPTAEEEDAILLRFQHDTTPPDLEPVTTSEELAQLQRAVTEVRIDDMLRAYIIGIIRATRVNQALMLGGSPRAGMALFKTAQAKAALDGRDFVTPDDIKTMTPYVLPHRMLLTSNARLRGNTADQVVAETVASVPVPIER
jgi:MoxR-like ATPase